MAEKPVDNVERAKKKSRLRLSVIYQKKSKKALKIYAQRREIAYSGTPKNLCLFRSQFDDKSSYFYGVYRRIYLKEKK